MDLVPFEQILDFFIVSSTPEAMTSSLRSSWPAVKMSLRFYKSDAKLNVLLTTQFIYEYVKVATAMATRRQSPLPRAS